MDLIYITKHLNTQRKCVRYLEQKRWDGIPTCPYCGSQRSGQKRLRHNCLDCTNSYSVTVGTVFENTNLPLMKWFMAISLMLSAKKGLSSMQLSRDISVNKNTAWLLQMKIRNVMSIGELDQLSGIIEVDETFVGGKIKKYDSHKKKRNKGGPHHLKPVLGMLQRQGKVITKVVESPYKEIVMPILKTSITHKSTVVTDGSQSYFSAKKHFEKHITVSHSTGVFNRGIYHTNTIEGFWSLIKRAIVGQYHKISVHYMQFYLDEISFKYNHKASPDKGYSQLISQML
jgi:transposase-like protein